jgi:hypothetical protein
MRETIIMRGAYVITDSRLGASGVISAGAVVIVDGTIRETGPFAAIAPRYPGIGERSWLKDHRPRTIDVEGLYREVRAFCAKGLTSEQRARAEFFRKIKPYVQAWYGTWHESMLDQPFYRVNSRT